MKKIVLVATAALMMGALFTSCQKEENVGPRVFHATMESAVNKQLVVGTQPQWVYYIDDASTEEMNYVFMYDADNNVRAYYPHRPAGVPSTQAMGTAADLVQITGFGSDDYNEATAAKAYCSAYPAELLMTKTLDIFGHGYVLIGLNTSTYEDGGYVPMAAQVGGDDNLYFRSITGMIDVEILSSDIDDMRLDDIKITTDNSHSLMGVYSVDFDTDGIPQPTPIFSEPSITTDIIERSPAGKHYLIPIIPGTYSQFDIAFRFERPNSKDGNPSHQIVKSLQTGNSITFTRNVIVPVKFNLSADDLTPIQTVTVE